MTSSYRAVMVALLVWAALGCHRQPPFLMSSVKNLSRIYRIIPFNHPLFGTMPAGLKEPPGEF